MNSIKILGLFIKTGINTLKCIDISYPYVLKNIQLKIVDEVEDALYGHKMSRRELPHYVLFEFIGEYYYDIYYKLDPGEEPQDEVYNSKSFRS